MIRIKGILPFVQAAIAAVCMPVAAGAATIPQPVTLAAGWQMQDAAKVTATGAEVASAGFDAKGWYAATVPGTALTTLVDNKVYPEPLYGENSRPERIPESLAHTQYWYRATVRVPRSYRDRRVWLNFDGINYSARVWVNGGEVGKMRGAFVRGRFDVTEQVKAGQQAVVAVLVAPQPHPGVPHEHTVRAGVGPNGGISAMDGPTFLPTIGWDWLATVRDRDTGIWRKVYLSATGPAVVKDPLVVTDLPLPRTDTADVTVQATVENASGEKVAGVLEGTIENIRFSHPVELEPHSAQRINFDVKNTPTLHMEHPRLWWPNGYGEQNLYRLHLEFKTDGTVSDAGDVDFGVREIAYAVPGSDTLTISVNGVQVFIRGGDWGLDEAMKRIPRERLETQIRLHQLAHLNMIRNWVGQSTNEDFYELCDKYGMLVWDEFFQPYPGDGPDPEDLDTYIANVRDKVLRYRNHPSIAVWCARNEGNPPPAIDAALRNLLAELEPARRYQPSSTDGGGVRSGGPYSWRAPRAFYAIDGDLFKTETGSVSVPTLESIHGMLEKKDWETIDDAWAEHDFARGNSGADRYRDEIAARYGDLRNLADFVRKAQMANYEAYRAMYEGRNAQMFHPATGVLTWMSNPAQPSFVWQLYHYDFEPMASYFAVMHAAEPVHIQLNEADGRVQVINNTPEAVADAVVSVAVYNLDGTLASKQETKLTAAPETVTSLGPVNLQAVPAAVHFIRLELRDGSGKLLSRNFYWRGAAAHPDNLTDLGRLPVVALTARVDEVDGRQASVRQLQVTLHNPTRSVALMAHIQLRRKSGERVLPVYYSDNYVTLTGDETRTINVEAAQEDFKGEDALIVVDGWNVTVEPARFADAAVAPNLDAQPERQPETGFPAAVEGLR